ncbi:Sas10/Utp3/C1D family-domain-containing protein [Nemania sp. NC0429]|nr:Sas10/Utp3/C1D family-domain-containing protein [Nemania sp. NC0429]
MDPANILPWLERLDDAVDNLEEATQPLVDNMADIASKLPLLDKAKIYVLMTYSIESVLFSALRLNEVDAKEHPIFKELARVRQYFEKIQSIEFPPQRPEQTLDKGAAIRFIRSDLADNKEINTKLSELIAKERARAALKSSMSAKSGEKRKVDEATRQDKPSEETQDNHTALAGGLDEAADLEDETQPKKKKTRSEKRKKSERKKKDRKSKTKGDRSERSSED